MRDELSIDDRFAELVRELRAARPAAPEPLRARVLAAAARAEGAHARAPRRGARGLARRRIAIVLAAALLAAAAGGAVLAELVGSGSGPPARREARDRSAAGSAAAEGLKAAPTAASAGRSADRSARSPSRAQDYRSQITLRVADLPAATRQAQRITRSLGGFERSLDETAGRAELVLRIPTDRVEEAQARLAALGEAVARDVAIHDLQPGLDSRARALVDLRAQIASVTRRLREALPAAPQRPVLEAELARLRAKRTTLERVQSQARREASFATLELGLLAGG
jgi:hypothetical protein